MGLSEVADQVKFDVLTATQDVDNEALMREIGRSFLSDTLTVPSKEMFVYAARASLGDAVYGDASTKALEAHIARLTGKEGALLMPSGTMSNQIAVRTHLKQPPYSVLLDHRAHIHKYEGGGTAFHSGATVLPVVPVNGHHLTVEDIKANAILGSDIHFAPTELVALENTLNGTIFPQEEIVAISEYVHSQGIKLHLDGARLWHVAAATETPMKTLCEPFDTISLCFSKGLGAPIGSVLVGPAAFIERARWFRKVFGGGMRQTGFMAASAAYALTHNFPLLCDVHALALKLETGLAQLGVDILSRAETCMIFYDASPLGLDYAEINERALKLPEPLFLGGSRLVVHIQTTEAAVNDLLKVIAELAEEKRKAGWVRPEKTSTTSAAAYRDVYVRPVKSH